MHPMRSFDPQGPRKIEQGPSRSGASKTATPKDKQLVCYVPEHSKEELGGLAQRDKRSVASSSSAFNMLCQARSTPSPGRLFVDSHESALRMLSGLNRFCQTGSLGFAPPPSLTRALQSYRKDCSAIFRANRSIRGDRLSSKVRRPLGAVCVDGGFEGWMGAMKDLAIYRRALTPRTLAGLMRYRERRCGKPDMGHNFTRVGMRGLDNILIHNTKAANGEGATRVMSLVGQGKDGAWGIIRPDERHLDRIFEREDARSQLSDLQAQLGDVQSTIEGLERSIQKLRRNIKTAAPAKRAGMQRGIESCNEKLRAPRQEEADLKERIEALEAAANRPAPRMLDLSYDDIHTGLQQLQRANHWSDQQMAGALLDLLHGGGSRQTIRALCKPVTIEGIKVKDVLNPRDDPKTGDVRMTGMDLCQTLLSIMFLTEPKHALPMAIANGDALKAVVSGAVPLSALFAPVEIAQEDGQLNFRLGAQSENLGALLASANNLRTVLDPSDPAQRRHKELAMPLCEVESLRASPDALASLLRGGALPVDQTEQAAVLFPILKSILMRALVEKHNE